MMTCVPLSLRRERAANKAADAAAAAARAAEDAEWAQGAKGGDKKVRKSPSYRKTDLDFTAACPKKLFLGMIPRRLRGGNQHKRRCRLLSPPPYPLFGFGDTILIADNTILIAGGAGKHRLPPRPSARRSSPARQRGLLWRQRRLPRRATRCR